MTPSQRHLFDLPREVAYFNCAYMSPLLREAAAVGAAALVKKKRPWTIAPVDFFDPCERARGLFGQLIGATADDVALIPAASYGLAIAAANLPVRAGERILVLADQFPSNVYTWQELARRAGAEVVTVAWPDDGAWTRAVLAALDERVAIAALPHCHWTDGSLLDLAAIGERCRSVRSALVLDVTQSLGALPLDLAAVQPDFMVAAGYKWLLHPYSTGYVYIAPVHQNGRPLEESWIAREGSEDFARLVDYQDRHQPGARRFDVGERANFALIPPSIVALEQLLAWGVAEIAATLAAKTTAIATRAEGLGLTAARPGQRAGHFLGLRLPGAAPADLLARLAAEQVHVSLRGDALRVTPHLYNDEIDAERLLDALERAL